MDDKTQKPEIEDPIAGKSYAKHFGFLGILLILSCAWCVWDETVSRRPWVIYQMKFRQISKQRFEQLFRKEQERVDRIKKSPEYEKALRKREKADEKFESPSVQEKYGSLTARLDDVKKRSDNARGEFQGLRGEYQEAEYLFNVKGNARAGKRMKKLAPRVAELETIIRDSGIDKKNIELEIGKLKAKHKALAKKLAAFDQRKVLLESKIDKASMESVGIKQVVLEDLGTVERCASCHLATDKGEFYDMKHPFGTHPNRSVLLDKHPVERFGCTVCHWGQGVATTSAQNAHGWTHYWEKPDASGSLPGGFLREVSSRLRQSSRGIGVFERP